MEPIKKTPVVLSRDIYFDIEKQLHHSFEVTRPFVEPIFHITFLLLSFMLCLIVIVLHINKH